jgi:hypothetical protein
MKTSQRFAALPRVLYLERTRSKRPRHRRAAIRALPNPAGAPAQDPVLDGQTRTFEPIGLTKPAVEAAHPLVVTTYRLGIGILVMIIVMLVAHIASTVFYLVDHSWIAPVASHRATSTLPPHGASCSPCRPSAIARRPSSHRPSA